jgi:hypothetical protein
MVHDDNKLEAAIARAEETSAASDRVNRALMEALGRLAEARAAGESEEPPAPRLLQILNEVAECSAELSVCEAARREAQEILLAAMQPLPSEQRV